MPTGIMDFGRAGRWFRADVGGGFDGASLLLPGVRLASADRADVGRPCSLPTAAISAGAGRVK
jgi:hypothetical protein